MRVNIYIRNKDVEKWDAIDNKSKWIHDHLNPREIAPPRPLTGQDVQGMANDLSKRSQQVYTDLEKPQDDWSGPIFRDKKKGKL